MLFKSKTQTHIDITKLAPLPSQGYAVGGAIRDLLLGRSFADIDWLVPNPYQEAKRVADELGGSLVSLDERRDFWRVVLPEKVIDYTALISSLEKNLTQRDFTINAVAADLNGELIDPIEGLKDFRNKYIRMVRAKNFYADPLRPLRGVRFAVQLGFTIEPKTKEAIKNNDSLPLPKAERISEELSKILMSDFPAQGIRLMNELGLLEVYLPELTKAKGVKQGGFHHLDVLDHLIESLNQLVQIFPEADLGLRWATLLHDIAKPNTQIHDPEEDSYRFYGHDRLGAEIAQEILKQLKSSKALMERVKSLVRYHMLPLPRNNKEARRFVHRRREILPDLLKLMIADREAARGRLSRELIRQNYRLAMSRVLEILAEQPASKPLLNGLEVIEILNLEPSAKVGKALDFLKESEAVGDIANKQEATAALKHYAKRQGWL